MSADHHHHHGPTTEQALWVAVALNAAFMLLEAGVGWWTNSLALLSDAGHMVSDVAALGIALVAVRLSKRAPSSTYTFGLRRAPVLGGLFNAASLMVVVVLIGVEAVERLQAPPALEAGPIFWTALAGLGVNLISAWYLARSGDKSVNTRGAMIHLLADALGSVAALISAVALSYGLNIADPIASVAVAVLIVVGTWPLLRDAVIILLQRAPDDVDVAGARALVEAHPEVVAVDDFHVWGLDAGQAVMSAVLTVKTSALLESNALADTLRAQLRAKFDVSHVTFECRHAKAPPRVDEF